MSQGALTRNNCVLAPKFHVCKSLTCWSFLAGAPAVSKKNAGLFYRSVCWIAQGWNQNVRGNILGFSFTTWNLHFPVYGTKMSEKTLVWQKIHVLKWSSSLLLSSYWILCIQVHAWHVCRTDTIQSERETSLSRPQASMCCFQCSKKTHDHMQCMPDKARLPWSKHSTWFL